MYQHCSYPCHWACHYLLGVTPTMCLEDLFHPLKHLSKKISGGPKADNTENPTKRIGSTAKRITERITEKSETSERKKNTVIDQRKSAITTNISAAIRKSTITIALINITNIGITMATVYSRANLTT